MGSKLDRLADVLRDHGKAWNVTLDTPRDSLVNEGVMAQDCLRAELLLRTLSPLLAKCEGAMEDADRCLCVPSPMPYWKRTRAKVQATLAELRKVVGDE